MPAGKAGVSHPALVRELLGRYPAIGTVRETRLLHQGAGCAKWLVTSTRGSLVLRCFPVATTRRRAALVAATHQHAATTTGLVPAVLANQAGQLITAHNGRLAMLVEHAEGVCDPGIIPDTRTRRRIGTALATLHLALRSLPAAEVAWPATGDPTAPLHTALQVHMTATCPHPAIRRALRAKLARAAALPPWHLELASSLPRSVIHGDFHLGNLVLADGRVAAVIDFDLARTFPPAYELIRGLLYCVKPTGGRAAFTERVNAFLEGYLATAALSDAEVAGMVPLFAAVQTLDPHGLDACHGAAQELLDFGQARFALLYWLDRFGPLLADLTRSLQRTVSASH